MKHPIKCPGVGRDKDCVTALAFYFSRPVTDDEMRHLHEVMQRAAECMPDFSPKPASRREGWHYDSQGYCDNPARGY